MAGPVERVFTAQPFATAGQRVIVSPFQFATSDDDNLQIVSANSLPGVVLTIQGRRVTTTGAVEPFSYVHVPNSDRSTRTENYKLGGGALLNLTIFASTGTPKIGQTYVSARIIRGLFGATLVLGGLLGGYVTAAQPLAFPGSPIVTSIEGPGVILNFDGTQPAAGANISETVPTGARWELLAFRADLTTDATVANRAVRLFVNGGGAVRWRLAQPTVQVASTIVSHIFAPGIGTFYDAPNNLAHAPLMIPVPLAAGMLIQTSTQGIAAGDQWSQTRLVVRELLEVNT